jgi:hypothetical protein
VILRALIEKLLPPRVHLADDPDQKREENAQAHREAADEARNLRRVVKGEPPPVYNDFDALTRWVDRRNGQGR